MFSKSLMQGVLNKRSRRGKWARRHFAIAGHYLKYHENDSPLSKLKGAADLSTLESITIHPPAEDGTANMTLFFGDINGPDGESSVPMLELGAPSAKDLEPWVKNLAPFHK